VEAKIEPFLPVKSPSVVMVTAVTNILTVTLRIFPWLLSPLWLLSPKKVVRSADISVRS